MSVGFKRALLKKPVRGSLYGTRQKREQGETAVCNVAFFLRTLGTAKVRLLRAISGIRAESTHDSPRMPGTCGARSSKGSQKENNLVNGATWFATTSVRG